MAYIPDNRAVIQPQRSYTTTSKFIHEYSRDICHISSLVWRHQFCTCAVTESLQRIKAMKRVWQVNTQSLKKRKKEPIDGRFFQELSVWLPHIAESVRCVSLLLVSIVLFFFDVSVSYRIYYMYHGFSVYMI